MENNVPGQDSNKVKNNLSQTNRNTEERIVDSMATLLYLEDNGYLLSQTLRFLEDEGYTVISYNRIDQVIDYVHRNPTGEGINCIITDLNMEDQWLGEYQEESDGGLLAGWVLLNRFVYAKEAYRRIPSIIYSGYIKDLKNYLRETNELDLLNQYPVCCVSKGAEKGTGFKELVRALRKLIP